MMPYPTHRERFERAREDGFRHPLPLTISRCPCGLPMASRCVYGDGKPIPKRTKDALARLGFFQDEEFHKGENAKPEAIGRSEGQVSLFDMFTEG